MTFKNSGGVWLTTALFFETTLPDNRQHAVFTLKDADHTDEHGNKYLSLKRLFLEHDDPTEYTFAKEVLGGWAHWKVLQKQKDVANLLKDWREEKEIALRSDAIVKMIDMASEEGASFQTVKWVTDAGWAPKQTKGRPTKEQINKEAKRKAEGNVALMKDYARLIND